jgi:hypothetical protein
MAYRIDRGRFGDVPLDGLGFVVLGYTPGEMIKGNWTVGLIVDERANAEQRDAIAAITSGTAGGPLAVLGGLIGNFAGLESAPIQFEQRGVEWTVKAGPLVDMGAKGALGLDPDATEPMKISGAGHPASDTLALCRATRSHVHGLGFTWDDESGRNNGHYAPFDWRN